MSNTEISYDRATLIGTWFGRQINEQGQEVLETAEIFTNGEFELSFCNPSQQGSVVIERGLWGLCENIHFTITLLEEIDGKTYQADTALAENYQAYRVLRLDGQVFEYQHLGSGEKFSLVRVDDPVDNTSQH